MTGVIRSSKAEVQSQDGRCEIARWGCRAGGIQAAFTKRIVGPRVALAMTEGVSADAHRSESIRIRDDDELIGLLSPSIWIHA